MARRGEAAGLQLGPPAACARCRNVAPEAPAHPQKQDAAGQGQADDLPSATRRCRQPDAQAHRRGQAPENDLLAQAAAAPGRRPCRSPRHCRRPAPRRSSALAAARSGRRAGTGQVPIMPPPGKRPVWRRASPSTIAAAWATFKERRPGRKGITSLASAAVMHLVGHAGAFPPHQQRVAGREGEIGIGHGPLWWSAAPAARAPAAGLVLEPVPGGVAANIGAFEIIHAGAAEIAVR